MDWLKNAFDQELGLILLLEDMILVVFSLLGNDEIDMPERFNYVIRLKQNACMTMANYHILQE